MICWTLINRWSTCRGKTCWAGLSRYLVVRVFASSRLSFFLLLRYDQTFLLGLLSFTDRELLSRFGVGRSTQSPTHMYKVSLYTSRPQTDKRRILHHKFVQLTSCGGLSKIWINKLACGTLEEWNNSLSELITFSIILCAFSQRKKEILSFSEKRIG